jgi:tRNA U34 5-methylaminomethyl-2-thiouridine-forming methyltransferase MnmC
MEREIVLTADGSHSITIPALGETYHSHHGAIQESMHVFIRTGLLPYLSSFAGGQVNILEIGFGTGLNALLTLIEVEGLKQQVRYTAVEPYPLSKDESDQLNYCTILGRPDMQTLFTNIHNCDWGKDITIHPLFTIHKSAASLLDYSTGETMHLVYFDAFSPSSQPDLWSVQVFENLFNIMPAGGILVTYCSKSVARKAMKAAGFTVQKLNGPWGKREIVRATKPSF